MSYTKEAKRSSAAWADAQVESPQQAWAEIVRLDKVARALVEKATHSIETYTPAGDSVAMNAGWHRLWGMEPAVMEDYNMLKDENLHQKETWQAIKNGFGGTAGATPEALFSPEEIGMPGRERWTDGYIAPVFDSGDEISSVVLMLRDITDMKLTTAEISNLRNRLQALQFQYDAIHDRLEKLEQKSEVVHRVPGLPPSADLIAKSKMLSKRERQVFMMIADDKPIKEIAFDLNLGAKSVYTYRARLLVKLGLTSDVQLAAAFREIAAQER